MSPIPRSEASLRLRNGFTLLELILATTLAAIVLITIRETFHVLQTARTRLEAQATAADARANGERLLAALVARLEPATGDLRRLAGTGDRATFDSWCDAAGGWLERCTVELLLQRDRDSTTVTGIIGTHDTLTLLRMSGTAALTYLGSGDSASWLTTWGQTIAPPRALAIAGSTDTLVLPTWSSR